MRIGIIGSNFIVDTMVDGAKKVEGLELTAIYSRSYEKGLELSKKYGIPNVFDDLDEMAKSSYIDGVYIASPNALHHSQSIKFLEMGKAVLCEKAVASNVRELEEMIEAAKRNKTLFMEAIRTIHNPKFRLIKAKLEEISPIKGGVGIYCQYSSRYDKFKAGEVLNAFKLELSNGSLVDIGIYPLYLIISLFGKPQDIVATGELLSTGVDGLGVINLKYKDFTVDIHHSKVSNSYIPSEIRGERGAILIDMVSTLSGVRVKYRDGREEIIPDNSESNDMYYELNHFKELFSSGKIESDENSFDNMLAVYQVVERARKEMGVIYPADLQGSESSSERLKKCRDTIDKIDSEILELIEKRVLVVKEVGEIKGESGGRIYVPKREEEIFERISGLSKSLTKGNIRSIYREIISSCRAFEELFTVLILEDESREIGSLLFGNSVNLISMDKFNKEERVELNFIIIPRDNRECSNLKSLKPSQIEEFTEYATVIYKGIGYIVLGKRVENEEIESVMINLDIEEQK